MVPSNIGCFPTLSLIPIFSKTEKELQQQTDKQALVRGLFISIVIMTRDVILRAN